ncbi:right-handed parallel beta-helix repeat-containing protein [Marinobacter sp. CHS3-4]|uniref:right-handed parallel beta-helix repeat-containing protein n=1 Tax=Marinobacter sp. CHS3-4 TaxID=3045174 RepID=UPI0024B4C801|nr:right-handed parallel beta-helix repeat-containing protein [Marinobacter sp. CHS3-4]MDI9245575.1 right-handed parallel beta-helix repeat-containing protein [Marinobacter sp. CHS3-4]
MGSITRFLLLLSIALCLPLVAYGQTTEEIDPNALYVDQDHPNASDGNDGRYQEMGGTGPFKTIQTLVDALEPGMTGYVRESSTPYFQDYRASGAAFGGITFTKGGAEGARVVVAGYPGETPLIDQRLSVSTDESKPMSAFHIFKGDYITIRNFEITKTRASGIFTNPGSAAEEHIKHLIIENVHVHHLYGADNLGGVRLDNCESCIVRNSIIHDIYDTRYSSNSLNSEPYGLHSAIHGYGPRKSTIEKNTIFNVKRGVYQKQPNAYSDKSNVVRQNVFKDVAVAYSLEVAGYNAPAAYDAEFYGNLVVDTGTAVKVMLQETASQSTGLKVYNNTLFNTVVLSYIRGITGAEVFNNIVVGSNDYPIYSERTGAEELGNQTQYNLVDYNLYYDVPNIALIDRSGDYYYFKDLEAWQTAVSVSGAEHLAKDPGVNSISQDPLFVDAIGGDFHTLNDIVTFAGRGEGYSSELGVFGLFDDVGAQALSDASPTGSAAPNPPSVNIQ